MTLALGRLNHWLRQKTRQVVDAVLARDENGPRFRTQALTAFFGLLWFAAVLVEHPTPGAGLMETLTAGLGPADLLFKPLIIVVYAAIHPNVLRHLVLPLITVWWTIRSGARYLDDLLELNDFDTAQRYLQSALLGWEYEMLEIKDGEVTEASRSTTVFKVGGPGYLKIHLGNAALFERIGGVSTICTATHRQFLQGFERLREVVDLRDQIRQPPDMKVYTRDGVAVRAIDIQAAFRLWSGRQSRSRNNPYPLDKRSVRQVVYGKAVDANAQSASWTEAAARMAAGAVARYIGSRLLKELIAQKTKVGAIPPQQMDLATSGHAAPVEAVARGDLPDNTRIPLSLSFYEEEAARRFQAAGVDLIWIGVGTLDTPPDITEEWINAWQADVSGRKEISQLNPAEQKRRERGRIIERLLTDISKWWSLNQSELSYYRRYSYSSGRSSGRADSLDPMERSFVYNTSSEEMQPAMDVLRLYSMKLQEQRSGLDAQTLPPMTEEALVYLQELANPRPRIIGE